MRLVDEAHVGDGDLAVSFDIDLVGSVDHDLADIRVAEQPVDRPVPQDVVEDGLDEDLAFGGAECEALLGHRPLQLLFDLLAQLGFRDPLVIEQRAQLLHHELVHLVAEVLEGVDARVRAR